MASQWITASSVSRAINSAFAGTHPFKVREGVHIEVLFDPRYTRITEYLTALNHILKTNRYIFTVRRDLGKVLISGKNAS